MYGNMNRARISQQPSHYPPLAFHLLRLSQLISALIVASILSFFVHYLRLESLYVPWAFLLLLSVCIVTVTILLATSALYHLRTLSPKLNLTINGVLSILWILGLSFLTWNLGHTLRNRCTIEIWEGPAGIMVCRLYKALTAFAVTGLLATLLATLLDIRTHRQTTNRGTYNPMLDVKHSQPYSSTANQEPYSSREDPYNSNPSQQHYDEAYKVQRPMGVQSFGNGEYSAPSEQTTYDGGYSGVH